MNSDDSMVMYLIHHQQLFKQLIQPFTDQYNELVKVEDSLFFGDIEKQYLDVVRWTIARELTKATGATVEDAFILLETMNIQDYIK